MKVGVLYPRSKAHPGMMADFAQGIKSGLDHFQVHTEIQLVSEIIGFGGNEKEVYDKVEKLLVIEGVDLVVAYIDQRVISLLEPLLYSHGKLMVIVNPGANYPENWIPQPGIIQLTLGHSFLCWLTGLLAGRNNNTGAVVATSFFDAGYLHIASITKSYMNMGGNIRYNYVNNNPYDDSFEIKPLTDFLAADKEVITILSVFDLNPAALFYDRLNRLDESDRLELYVSPMMLDKKAWKINADSLNFSIQGHVPYFPEMKSKENTIFKNSLTQRPEQQPSIFTLQGWEVAILLTEILASCEDHYTDGAFIADHLASKILASPRGELKFDKETHFFIPPAFKATLKKNTVELLVTEVENLEEEWKRFIAEPLAGPTSGWTNTYLCY